MDWALTRVESVTEAGIRDWFGSGVVVAGPADQLAAPDQTLQTGDGFPFCPDPQSHLTCDRAGSTDQSSPVGRHRPDGPAGGGKSFGAWDAEVGTFAAAGCVP